MLFNRADSRFSNVQEQVWTWVNDGDEYFYDKLDWVRIRVEEEHWHDLTPVAPSERNNASIAERKSPYSIVVSHPVACLGSRLTSTGFNDTSRARTSTMVVGNGQVAKTHVRFQPAGIRT